MTEYQLNISIPVTLDGSGNGQVSLGPSVVREFWKPSGATVSVSSQTREATCYLYLGNTPNNSALLGASESGSTGDTYGFADFKMVPGQQITAKWVGGDAGATATLKIIGQKGRFQRDAIQ